MSFIDSLPRFLFPTRSHGARWFREQLRELGVTAPLSPGCLDEFIMDAARAAQLVPAADRTYATALRQQVQIRARFVHVWTTTDETLAKAELSEFVAIARKHLLPRAWVIPQTSVTEVHRNDPFGIPRRLVVKGSRRSPARELDSGDDLPGAEILSDLKQAGDKS